MVGVVCREGGRGRTVRVGAEEDGDVDDFALVDEGIGEVLEEVAVDAGRPVEEGVGGFVLSRERLGDVGVLEDGDGLASQAGHLV